MRVALDLRWLQQAYVNSPDGGLGGIATFSRNLWVGLAESHPAVELIAILRQSPIAPELRAMIDGTPDAEVLRVGGHHAFMETRAALRLASRFLETEWIGLPSLSKRRVDILHTLDHTPPPKSAHFATVVTVYDLIGLADPSPTATFTQRLMARYQQTSALRFDRAAAVAPVSESTAGHLKRRFPNLVDRIDVIPPGIRTVRVGGESSAWSPRLGSMPRRYFLHVGLLTPRKNPVGLIEGFRTWTTTHGRDATLVCVGPYEANGSLREGIAAIAQANRVEGSVCVLNAVSESELAVLYRGAEALVFPSFDEGFGMPLLESLAYGTPCVASDQAVSHEAAGPLGIYVDPHSPASIARGIERAGGEAHRSLVRRDGPVWSRQFSLGSMAERYIRLYRRSVQTRPR
jgi:glycosyltransferase involved in cell wall biosynthesis